MGFAFLRVENSGVFCVGVKEVRMRVGGIVIRHIGGIAGEREVVKGEMSRGEMVS